MLQPGGSTAAGPAGVALAEPGKFLRTVAPFATARSCLRCRQPRRIRPADTGEGDVELHFTTPADEPLTLALLAPAALQWRERDRRNPRVLRAAVTDALARRRPK